MKPWQALAIRIVLTCAGMVVTFLPRRLELVIGGPLGAAYGFVLRKRRRIAYENIRRCFPTLGSKGWEQTLKANYKHYGILGLELMHLFSKIPLVS